MTATLGGRDKSRSGTGGLLARHGVSVTDAGHGELGSRDTDAVTNLDRLGQPTSTALSDYLAYDSITLANAV